LNWLAARTAAAAVKELGNLGRLDVPRIRLPRDKLPKRRARKILDPAFQA